MMELREAIAELREANGQMPCDPEEMTEDDCTVLMQAVQRVLEVEGDVVWPK